MIAPLLGFTVGVTGHRRWEEQAEILTRRGAKVMHGPTMATNLLGDSDQTFAATREVLAGPVDMVVFITGLGIRSWFSACESWGLDDDVRAAFAGATIVVRGPKAASAALAAGLTVGWMAETETNAEVLERLGSTDLSGKRIVVQRDGGAALVADEIRAMGADVVDVPVYEWTTPDDASAARRLLDAATAGRLDAVTFTCSYAVRSAFDLAPDPDGLRAAFAGRVRAVAVGPVTAATLREHGIDRIVEPRRARLGSMMHALTTELETMTTSLRLEGSAVRWQGSMLIDADETCTELTNGERHLLSTLISRSPAVIAKAELIDGAADEHAVEAAIARLRAKLGPLGAGITTVRRRGYACSIEVAGS